MIKPILHIAIVLFLCLLGCTEYVPHPIAVQLNGVIKLSVPEGYIVGKEIICSITTPDSLTQEAVLLLDNGITIKTLGITTNNNLTLKTNWLQQAGRYKLTVIQQNKILATKSFILEASQLIEPLEIYTGPTTILVNGQEESMLTYIPADKYDNGISTPIAINYNTSVSFLTSPTDSIHNLISYKKLSADIKAEKIILGVSTNALSSTEQVVEKIADWPDNIEIETVQHHPYADNRQYTRLKTKPMYDSYGNQIADGTILLFSQSLDEKLNATYKAIVIDGVANAYLRNPDKAGTFSYQATVGQAESNKILLTYNQLVDNIPYQYSALTSELIVGPIISKLGQLVPDGTEVNLKTASQEFSSETVDGKALLDLQTLSKATDSAILTVGGLQISIDL